MELTGIRSASDLVRLENGSDPSKELGKTQFLELMIAQFNNQDPLKPADNQDFIAQLAQFSSLEGIENLNSSVDRMAASMRSSLTLEAAALVGRSVLVPTDQALMTENGIGGNIRNSEASSELTVEISTLGGALIRRMPLGAQNSGEVRFLWDGTNDAGDLQPVGAYRIRAFSTVAGEQREVTVELPDLVVSVSLDERGVTVNLAAGTSVPVTEIREIQ
ncbi:MAG: flagellar hook assembly protein FlgD [Gammaproteobacteria bacterium]|nr:flagellar hook assembly protein FlgD [Gammaproteobacteria bacterium]